jgi:hypothetical protein
MAELVSVGEAELEHRDGAQALQVLREMQGALMSALESQLSYVVLWEQFLVTPHEVALALTSVVQALMDADSMLADWLTAALDRYRQAAGA